MFKKRFIQYITNSRVNPQFCQIKEPEQVLQRAGKSHKISSQRIEKYLPGKK